MKFYAVCCVLSAGAAVYQAYRQTNSDRIVMAVLCVIGAAAAVVFSKTPTR